MCKSAVADKKVMKPDNFDFSKAELVFGENSCTFTDTKRAIISSTGVCETAVFAKQDMKLYIIEFTSVKLVAMESRVVGTENIC